MTQYVCVICDCHLLHPIPSNSLNHIQTSLTLTHHSSSSSCLHYYSFKIISLLKAMQGGSGSGGGGWTSTVVSKDENLVLSSEDSSSPNEECHLQLGLSLSLSPYVTASSCSLSSTPYSHSVLANNSTTSQVVGWPPLRAYRMTSYNSHAKSPVSEVFNSMVEKSKVNSAVVRKSYDNGSVDNSIIAKENRNPRSSRFVKVKMDGVPIGRKVDLSAHNSYETLAQTLEDMFNEPNTVLTCKVGQNGGDHGIIVGSGRQLKLLDGSSNFVLTYEDKEGDWMLVGDVPWRMFISSVRRLRIMRTSEANGLAPRLEEQNNRLKSKPI